MNVKSNTSNSVKKRIAQQKKLFLKTYKSKVCNVSSACDAINISRTTFYEWRKTDKNFDDACREIEMSLIDFAESRLMKNISDGKETSLFFFLVNRAPERWRSINRVELSAGGDTGKKIDIVLDGLAKLLNSDSKDTDKNSDED